MNTERIKNIMIVLLSGLALVLMVLVVADGRQYVLSDDRIVNITEILSQNQIGLGENIQIPQNFRPMRQMELSRYNHDILDVAQRFFGNPHFSVNFEGNNQTFSNPLSQNTMTYFVREGEIVFEMNDGFFIGVEEEDFARTAIAAEITARAFIDEILGEAATNMTLSSNRFTATGHYLLTFFDSYAGHLLYDSRIIIRVAERGIASVSYFQAAHNSFIGYAHPIFAADEAFMALLNHLHHTEGIFGPIEINNIQVVYIIDPRGNQNRAVPAYFFSITSLQQQIRFDVVFNAFTNIPIVGMQIVH